MQRLFMPTFCRPCLYIVTAVTNEAWPGRGRQAGRGSKKRLRQLLLFLFLLLPKYLGTAAVGSLYSAVMLVNIHLITMERLAWLG